MHMHAIYEIVIISQYLSNQDLVSHDFDYHLISYKNLLLTLSHLACQIYGNFFCLTFGLLNL